MERTKNTDENPLKKTSFRLYGKVIAELLGVNRIVAGYQMSNLGFRVMAFTFKIRDFFRPRKDIVREVGIKEGFRILDYGCGSGSYVTAVSELVGKSGTLYALDAQPIAIKMVKKIVVKKQLTNVETILSDCKTGLPDDSLDRILLYDVFHDLTDPDCVLKELHHVLKSDGILSFSDHHLKEPQIISRMTKTKLFELLRKGQRTYSFVKATNQGR
jgi:ubiquinone/menaquinone biosynthesis C-methylase UbiE